MEEKDQKISKKIIWITLFIVILILIGGIFGVTIPVTRKIFSLKDELEKNKLEYRAAEKEITEREEIMKTIATIVDQGKILDEITIKEETAIVFIEEIERLAHEVGSQISIIPTSSPQKKKSKNEDEETNSKNKSNDSSGESNGSNKDEKVYFNLKLEGNYSQFLKFLCQLENLDYIFDIESVGLFSKNKLEQNFNSRSNQEENKKPESVLESNVLISFSVKELKNKK